MILEVKWKPPQYTIPLRFNTTLFPSVVVTVTVGLVLIFISGYSNMRIFGAVWYTIGCFISDKQCGHSWYVSSSSVCSHFAVECCVKSLFSKKKLVLAFARGME